MGKLTFIRPAWPVSKRIFCASTTCYGGVSQRQFESLNLGDHVGDNPLTVAANRLRLSDAISTVSPNAKQITWLKQTHSTKVVHLDDVFAAGNFKAGTIEADASYTTTADIPCTVMTADCMALMIANTQGTEVAAVHAGWKGLLNGVIENAVAKFRSAPTNLHVWFAPSISQANFEVGEELADAFSEFPDALMTSTSESKYLLSLIGVANEKLDKLGVFNRYYSNICTYSANNLFSHRQATHQGLSACGRMANMILIKNLNG